MQRAVYRESGRPRVRVVDLWRPLVPRAAELLAAAGSGVPGQEAKGPLSSRCHFRCGMSGFNAARPVPYLLTRTGR